MFNYDRKWFNLSLTSRELERKTKKGKYKIFDIRTRGEFEESHHASAEYISHQFIKFKIFRLAKDAKIVIIGRNIKTIIPFVRWARMNGYIYTYAASWDSKVN